MNPAELVLNILALFFEILEELSDTSREVKRLLIQLRRYAYLKAMQGRETDS